MVVQSRRQFLFRIGSTFTATACGLVAADTLGSPLARRLGERLRFGRLDPLVDLIQATPADDLLGKLVAALRAGTPLADIVAATAFANARALGGTHYDGYHVQMALLPAYAMAQRMPGELAALPVLKVVHRNASVVQAAGRATRDALAAVAPAAGALVEDVRKRDLDVAEGDLEALAQQSAERAFVDLQRVVRDEPDVHRVVLSWRAFDLLRLTGGENAAAMLRQSVRYCVDADRGRVQRGQAASPLREILAALEAELGLAERIRGDRRLDDAQLAALAEKVYAAPRAEAARAVAEALADGRDPEDVGEALSLAANRLLLHDPGRTKEQPGKPVGSVHGASVGVHASDAANAWRHIARIGPASHAFASLIAGAFHTAGQTGQVVAERHDHAGKPVTAEAAADLLKQLDGCIREGDQPGASLAARRYAVLGHPAGALLDLLLQYAVTEDCALHAEKYFLTGVEQIERARPAHRPDYCAALARVAASQHGFAAPGVDEARRLLAS